MVFQSKVNSSLRDERVLGVITLSVLAEMAGDQMKPFLKVSFHFLVYINTCFLN
jgi:hypothetical protein